MQVKTYKTSKNVKLSKHFMSNEFRSHVNGVLTTKNIMIYPLLVTMLERFFDYGVDTVIILSGYRDKKADIAVGGNGCGAHTFGLAADITCYIDGKALSGEQIACLAQLIGFSGIGITGDTGCHVDVRTAETYDNAHWWGDERADDWESKNNICDFFKYTGITKPRLFGDIGYYKEKCYTIKAKNKTAIYSATPGTKIKKYYSKGKKARIFAEKNGRGKVLSGWIKLADTTKV